MKSQPKSSAIEPPREALARAIADVGAAERALEDARAASSSASRRRFDAENKLEALRQKMEEEKSSHNVGSAFISALSAGGDIDAATLDRTSEQALEQEKQLLRDIDLWSKAQASCKAIIPDRENDLYWANNCLKQVLPEVLRTVYSSDMLDRAHKLFDEFKRLHVAMSFLLLEHGIPEADESRARAFVYRNIYMEDDPQTAVAWKMAFEALKRDANAPLPALMEGQS